MSDDPDCQVDALLRNVGSAWRAQTEHAVADERHQAGASPSHFDVHERAVAARETDKLRSPRRRTAVRAAAALALAAATVLVGSMLLVARDQRQVPTPAATQAQASIETGDVPLVGTTWRLTGARYKDTDIEVPGSANVPLSLTDNEAQVGLSCSSMTGPVEIRDESLTFGSDDGSALRFPVDCRPKSEQLDRAISAAWQSGPVTWSIAGSNLTVQSTLCELTYAAVPS